MLVFHAHPSANPRQYHSLLYINFSFFHPSKTNSHETPEILFVTALLMAFMTARSETVTYNDAGTPYDISIDKGDNAGELYVRFTLNKISFVTADDNARQTVPVIKDMTLGQSEGKPGLPGRNIILPLPTSAACSVEMLDSTYTDYTYEVAPAVGPVLLSETRPKPVEPIAAHEGFIYNSALSHSGIETSRERFYHIFSLRPVNYDHNRHTVRVCTSFTARITYDEQENTRLAARSRAFRNTPIFNDTIGVVKVIPDTEDVTEDYLILGVDYTIDKESLNNFIEWKKTQGYRVHLETINRTWRTNEIQDVIKKHYEKADVNLTHLLLLGTHGLIPGRFFYKDYRWNPKEEKYDTLSYHMDFFYSRMGTDPNEQMLPDINCGRIGISSGATNGINQQMAAALDKIVNYQRNPVTNPDFYKNVFLASKFENDTANENHELLVFVRTSEDIAKYLSGSIGKTINRIYCTDPGTNPTYWSNQKYYKQEDNEEIPTYLQRPNFAWNGTAANIKSAINQGSLLGIYNGHGNMSGWNFFNYTVLPTDTDYHNGAMQPLILSLCCTSGYLGFLNAFSYEMSRRANGAIGVIAGCCPTFTVHNDIFGLGMIDAIWSDPGLKSQVTSYVYNEYPHKNEVKTLGSIMNSGNYRLIEQLGDDWGLANNNIRAYHLFGDPSTQFYSEVPTKFTSPSITTFLDNITVSVLESYSSDTPVYVSFYDKKAQRIERYRTYGGKVTFKNASDSIVSVCISAHNKIPYIKECDMSRIAPIPPIEIDFLSFDYVNYDAATKKVTAKVHFPEGYSDFVSVSFRGINESLSLSHPVSPENDTVTFDCSKCSPGIYVVYLSGSGATSACTRKINIY